MRLATINRLQQSEMSSPPLRGTAEWSATREVALLLGLTGGNRYAAQQLWLRKERIKAEASQFASAGSQQASRQPAGCRAEPAPARAQAVPRQKTAAQLARSERNRERLFRKHLAKVAKVRPRLQAWLRRARANLGQPMELTQPAPPAGPRRLKENRHRGRCSRRGALLPRCSAQVLCSRGRLRANGAL